MVPDYDQRVPGIAHRGPTHTVWFAALVSLGVALAGGAYALGTGIVPL
jgi:inner membrane protein